MGTTDLVEKKTSIYTWIILSLLLGVLCGLAGGSFSKATLLVTKLRQSHPHILFLLPIGGVVVSLIYKLADYRDLGADLIISSINNDDNVPLRIFPVIYISAVLSHLIGASVGRVGTTIQLGGSLSYYISNKLKLNITDRQNLIAMGISGTFSALFGTPFACSLFAGEVNHIGRPNYKHFPFLLLTALIGKQTGRIFGFQYNDIDIGLPPTPSVRIIGFIILMAALIGLVSTLYCLLIINLRNFFGVIFSNIYVRSLIFGIVVLIISLILGIDKQIYNGMGTETVLASCTGQVEPISFLLKIVLTSLCFTAGYKGGEVYPAIFVGAAFGGAFANVLSLPPGIFAAIGVGVMFSGITNCPLAGFALCLEYFLIQGAAPIYFLIAIPVGFITSGLGGLYPSAKIDLPLPVYKALGLFTPTFIFRDPF